MNILLLALLVALNFGISWLNAWSVGRSWADSKAIGGWTRTLAWCGGTMSACGFTWCYLVIVAMVAQATGFLPVKYAELSLELGYVVIILPVLGSGLAIWLDSVTTAWRKRDVVSIGVAGWNTFAMAHNTYEAATTLPDVFKHIGDTLSGGDDDDAEGKLVSVAVLLVVIALCSGVFTTITIVRSTARKYATGVIADHGFAKESREGSPVICSAGVERPVGGRAARVGA